MPNEAHIHPGDLVKLKPSLHDSKFVIWHYDNLEEAIIDPTSPPILYIGIKRANHSVFYHKFLHRGMIYYCLSVPIDDLRKWFFKANG